MLKILVICPSNCFLKKSLLGLFLFLSTSLVYSQVDLIGLSTNWDDSFSEWTIYAYENEDDIEGELRLEQWQGVIGLLCEEVT